MIKAFNSPYINIFLEAIYNSVDAAEDNGIVDNTIRNS